eukprot:7747794-Pyramimonas_sp.AAC.1
MYRREPGLDPLGGRQVEVVVVELALERERIDGLRRLTLVSGIRIIAGLAGGSARKVMGAAQKA